MSVSSANEVVHRLRHLREVLVAVEQLSVCMGEPFVSAFATALADSLDNLVGRSCAEHDNSGFLGKSAFISPEIHK